MAIKNQNTAHRKLRNRRAMMGIKTISWGSVAVWYTPPLIAIIADRERPRVNMYPFATAAREALARNRNGRKKLTMIFGTITITAPQYFSMIDVGRKKREYKAFTKHTDTSNLCLRYSHSFAIECLGMKDCKNWSMLMGLLMILFILP
jgi:hypothetical protein